MALVPVVRDGELPPFPCSEESFLDAIKRSATPDIVDDYGRTALAIAIAEFRSIDLVKAILELGADPNATSSIGRIRCQSIHPLSKRLNVRGTALHVAVTVGNLEIVELLIAKGAEINLKTSKGLTPLQLALESEVLLDRERELSEDGNLELIRRLLAAGADVHSPYPGRKDTLLHRVAILGNEKIVQLLLSSGHQWDINALDKNGESVLHCACNNARVTDVFLENGADPNIACPSGNTPYHDASRKGNLEVMEILSKYGADPNVANHRGFTALHSLANDNRPNVDAVNLVLRHGGDPCVGDLLGRTPHYYIRAFEIDEAGKLLCSLARAGGQLNRRDSFGAPLWHSIVHYLIDTPDIIENKEGNKKVLEDVVKAYVKAGVDINAVDLQNRTALHLAGAHSVLDLVEVLLAHGADVNARDCDGNTPLHLAARHAFLSVIRRLKTAKDTRTDIPNLKMQTVDGILALTLKELQSQLNQGKTLRFAKDTYHEPKRMRNLEEDIAFLKEVTKKACQKADGNPEESSEFPGITCIEDPQSQQGDSQKHLDEPLGASTHWNASDVRLLSKYLREDDILFSFLLHKETLIPIEVSEDDRIAYMRCDAAPSVCNRLPNLSTRISEYCQMYSVGTFHLDEPCEDERCDIARQVRNLVEELVTKCSEIDPRLRCNLIQAGSTAEGTKMWAPDEFDFMMELTNLEGQCYIARESRSVETHLHLNEDARSEWGEFLQDGRFAPKQLRNYVAVLLWKASFSLQRAKFPKLRFNLAQYHKNVCSGCYDDQPLVKYSKVGALLRLQWLGDQYKQLAIDVDITPAIKLPDWVGDGSIPPSLRYLEKCGCRVVPLGLNVIDVNWRVSFSMSESRLMRDLADWQLNIYKALKLLQDIRFMDGSVPSYQLKMMVFNYLFKEADSDSGRGLAFHVHTLLSSVRNKTSVEHFFLDARIPVKLDLFPQWVESALAMLK